jgi:hypothetical protein
VIVAGANALAAAQVAVATAPEATEFEPQPASRVPHANGTQSEQAAPSGDELIDRVRAAVLEALANGGHSTLVSNLETGRWRIEGNELVVEAQISATFLEMAMTSDATRLVNGAIQASAKRMLKLKLEGSARGNGTAAPPPAPTMRNAGPAGSARSRAADDPVVRHLQEKFSAEIRTVIDHRDKRN